MHPCFSLAPFVHVDVIHAAVSLSNYISELPTRPRQGHHIKDQSIHVCEPFRPRPPKLFSCLKPRRKKKSASCAQLTYRTQNHQFPSDVK